MNKKSSGRRSRRSCRTAAPCPARGTGGTGGTGGSGGGGTYTGGTSGRNDVPLDGGLSILLAAGIGYGVKRARNRVKKTIF